MVFLAAFAPILSASSDTVAKPTWVCTLKVDNPKQQSKVANDTESSGRFVNKRWLRGRTDVKTTTSTLVLPVRVSVSGKDAPTSGFSLKTTFVGTHDDDKAIIGEVTTPVNLENGVCKTEIKSPQLTLVKKTTKAGSGSVSDKKGDRITGTIVQLVYDGKVVRSWSSKSEWSRLAREDTLDTKELLK